MIDDNRFFAWIDGELAPDDAAAVKAAVDADPALARRAEQHRALQASLRGAFDPIMTAPVPDRIGAAPIAFDLARKARDARPYGAVPQWAAIAATLAIGLFAGNLISFGERPSPVAMEGGRLIASGELDQALSSRLASAPVNGGPRIGLTFRNSNGAICRSFSGPTGAGLACRAGEDWEMRGLFGGAPSAGDGYRMAAGDDPRLAALVESSIAGEPFDAAQEAKAKATGWR